MKEVSLIFIFSSFSKVLVAAISLALIRFVEIEEYSHFILIFTFFTIIFQIVSSVIERLYIVEYEVYSKNEFQYNLILIVLLLFLPAGYVFFTQNIEDFFLIIFLSVTSIFFQIKRIRMQKNERYADYVKLEIKRNFLWALSAFTIVYFYSKGFYIYILYALGFINLLMLCGSVGQGRKSKEPGSASVKYILSKYYLILFSVIAGLFPFLVFIFISNTRDPVLIASIGAAMRYQALLSMVVLSMNTVFLPKLNAGVLSRESLMPTLWKQVKIALFISLAFILLTYYLIPVVDEGKYPDTQLFFVLISITTLVSLISLPIVNSLLANYKYKELFQSLAAALGVAYIVFQVMVMFEGDVIVALFLSMIVAYAVNFILNFTKYSQINKHENFNN